MPSWSSLARGPSSPTAIVAAAADTVTKLTRAAENLPPLLRVVPPAGEHRDSTSDTGLLPALSNATGTTDTQNLSTAGHSIGTLAGVFVAVLTAFMLMVGVCYYFYRRERLSELRQREPPTFSPDRADFSRQMRRAQTSYYLCGHESYQNLRAGSRLLLARVDGSGRPSRPIRLEAPRLADLGAARRLVSTGGALVTFPPSASLTMRPPAHPVTTRRRVHLYYRDSPPKGEEGSTCMICLEPLDGGVIVSGECMHWTHEECLKSWLAKSPQLDCPGCRAKLVEVPMDEQQES